MHNYILLDGTTFALVPRTEGTNKPGGKVGYDLQTRIKQIITLEAWSNPHLIRMDDVLVAPFLRHL